MTRFLLAAAAYLAPTFALGFLWHLVWFKREYEALAMYRADVVIPLGLLSMLVQAVLFTWVYSHTFARWQGLWGWRVLAYAGFGAVLSWSFTTLAVAAKNVMSSVPHYVMIETGFTLAQWLLVAPLTVLAFGRRSANAA
jgi:hypothetical protein